MACDWFKIYLLEPKQCVKVEKCFGEMGQICYGVSQGSVLGPILFLIYINNLCCADTALCYVEDSLEKIENLTSPALLPLQYNGGSPVIIGC